MSISGCALRHHSLAGGICLFFDGGISIVLTLFFWGRITGIIFTEVRDESAVPFADGVTVQ
jgi:hypothetical protein